MVCGSRFDDNLKLTLLRNIIAGDGDSSEQCKVTHLLIVRCVHRERESVSEGTVWDGQFKGDCNETGG